MIHNESWAPGKWIWCKSTKHNIIYVIKTLMIEAVMYIGVTNWSILLQNCSAIDESQFILCSGVLRNKNNSVSGHSFLVVNLITIELYSQKLHVFLFDKALVLTRPSSRTGTLMYQVLHLQNVMCTLMCIMMIVYGKQRTV